MMNRPSISSSSERVKSLLQDKVMPDNEDFTRSLDELIEGRFIIGSPEDCYNQLKPYWEEFGVNHIVVRTHWAGMPLSTALASIRLISDELLPELRRVQVVSPLSHWGSRHRDDATGKKVVETGNPTYPTRES